MRRFLAKTRTVPCRRFGLDYGATYSSMLCKPRWMSTIGPRNEEEAARASWQIGLFNWKSAALFLLTGTGLYLYFQREKQLAIQRKVQAQKSTQSVGKPKLGGPFTLIDQNGITRTEKDVLQGHFSVVYFGFTRCPDICPEELEKLSQAVTFISEKHGIHIIPVFITCDPMRDGVKEIAQYVKEFHPDMIGLTGTLDQVAKAAKAYRVYFSKPPNVKPGEDYLVDHSIFFYLMDPEGQFVDLYGKEKTVEQVQDSMLQHVKTWKPSTAT